MQGRSALEAGLLITPAALAMMVSAMISGVIERIVGPKLLAFFSMLIILAGMLVFTGSPSKGTESGGFASPPATHGDGPAAHALRPARSQVPFGAVYARERYAARSRDLSGGPRLTR